MKITKALLIALILLTTSVPLFAQSGAITYQGRLNAGGAPATGLYEIAFTLHDALTNGNAIGNPLTVAPVPVTNGLFTVMLDFGAGAFDGDDRWLELAVTMFGSDQPVVTLVPRQAVTATPYALYAGSAASAATLGGHGASSFWKLNGNAETVEGANFLGTTDRKPLEIRVNGITALRVLPSIGNSPTIVGGTGHEYWQSYPYAGPGCGILSGASNSLHFGKSFPLYSVVAGGLQNIGGGEFSTIGGGRGNHASARGRSDTVSGGEYNSIEGYSEQCTISGGGYNRIEGRQSHASTISGGSGNEILPGSWYPSGDTISGGIRNKIYGGQNSSASTIAGGDGNEIQYFSRSATIGGGDGNIVNAQYGTVPGGQSAAARSYGQQAYASGQFAAVGDAQTSVYVCRAVTTNATEQELLLNGFGRRIILPENATWTFDILVTGRTPGAASAGYQLRGVIENNAGATALIGSVNKTILAEDAAGWVVTAVADDTSDALVIRVTGADSTDIRWVASVRTVEVIH